MKSPPCACKWEVAMIRAGYAKICLATMDEDAWWAIRMARIADLDANPKDLRGNL